jgi:hypothetical protein
MQDVTRFTGSLPRGPNPDTGAFFNRGMHCERSNPTEEKLTAITAIAAHEIAESRRLRRTAAAVRAEYARVRKGTHPANAPMGSAHTKK